MQHFLKSRTAESVLRIEVREEAITSIAVIAGVMEQATNFWSGRKLLDFFFRPPSLCLMGPQYPAPDGMDGHG